MLMQRCQSNLLAATELAPMCDRPAVWQYIGIAPLEPDKAQYEWQTIQTKLALCLEHGRVLWLAVGGYATKKRPEERVTLERLGEPVIYFHCTECLTVVKYELRRQGDMPLVTRGAPSYCPQCGAQGSPAMLDPERDYWEILSEAFQNMDLRLLKLFYEQWLNDPKSPPRFRDYVDSELLKDDD